jgi:hypothetical protein
MFTVNLSIGGRTLESAVEHWSQAFIYDLGAPAFDRAWPILAHHGVGGCVDGKSSYRRSVPLCIDLMKKQSGTLRLHRRHADTPIPDPQLRSRLQKFRLSFRKMNGTIKGKSL